MDLSIVTYFIYLALSIGMTIWVARSLSKNGRYFLVDVFRGDWRIADSVNQLLVVGFYLINLGYICFMLKLGYELPNITAAIEALSRKVGMVLIVLGGMHFFNLFIFGRIRSRNLQDHGPRQVADGKMDEEPADAPPPPFYRYQRAGEDH